MNGLNKVMLIGNIGADPELRLAGNGNAVLTFRVATSSSWLDKNTNQRKESTEWHRCVMFGLRAEGLAKVLSKGKPVYIEGSISTRTYEKDGEQRYVTEVKVNDVILLGDSRQGRREPQQEQHQQPQRQWPMSPMDPDNDDQSGFFR